MFFIKKIAALSLMPLPLCLWLLGFGVLLLWCRRRMGLAKILLTVVFLFLILLSFSSVANQIVKPLESLHAPLLNAQKVQDLNWVVVLGGGHISNQKFSSNAQLGSQSLSRLVEGIRIKKMLPGSKLLLSGGGVYDPLPEADTMADVAHMLGVSRDDIILETQAKDTQEQAERIEEMLGPTSMILVTSAVHMPRAILVFEQVGLRPIPAPVDFSDWTRSARGPQQFFPSARELKKVEAAMHEYLGLLWLKLKSVSF